jgi:hypothetical protein
LHRLALSISTTLYEDGLDNYFSVAVAHRQAFGPLDYGVPAKN